MIDTHLHCWSRSHSAYAWLDDAPALAPFVSPREAVAASRAAGFESQILVQAEDSVADTRWMLAAVDDEASICGVVAWVPLDDQEAAFEMIEAWDDRVVGARALVHTYTDTLVLAQPAAAAVATLLASYGRPLDVPDAFPHLIDHATALAAATGATIVLDHLGKPPASREAQGQWRDAISRFAAASSTVAKISGLHHGGTMLQGDALNAVIDVALEVFGPDRLMLGSDSPMPQLADGDEAAAEQLAGIVAGLSPAERLAIGTSTATRVYLGGV